MLWVGFHELLQVASKDDQVRRALLSLAQSYFSDEHGREAMLLINSSPLVPFSKSSGKTEV